MSAATLAAVLGGCQANLSAEAGFAAGKFYSTKVQ